MLNIHFSLHSLYFNQWKDIKRIRFHSQRYLDIVPTSWNVSSHGDFQYVQINLQVCWKFSFNGLLWVLQWVHLVRHMPPCVWSNFSFKESKFSSQLCVELSKYIWVCIKVCRNVSALYPFWCFYYGRALYCSEAECCRQSLCQVKW